MRSDLEPNWQPPGKVSGLLKEWVFTEIVNAEYPNDSILVFVNQIECFTSWDKVSFEVAALEGCTNVMHLRSALEDIYGPTEDDQPWTVIRWIRDLNELKS